MARSTKQAPPRLPAPLPSPDSELRQRAWAALTLGLLSVIGLLFLGDLRRGVYVIAVTLIFGALAIWLGVSTSQRARGGGVARPRGTVGGIVSGSLGFTLSVLCAVVFAVFWSQLQAYSSCMDGANTVAAQQACQNQFSHSVNAEMSRLRP